MSHGEAEGRSGRRSTQQPSASDQEHLTLAREEERVVFTQDDDFLRLAAAGFDHAGIVYAVQHTPVGTIVHGLMLIYEILEPKEMQNHIEFL